MKADEWRIGELKALVERGADYPDGSATHDGDEFWADMADVADFSAVDNDA